MTQGTPLYDYQYILQQGKTIYGPDFIISDTDKPVVIRLLAYFLRDEALATAEGIDLNKGILLAGPIGCGKTSLMNIMRSICPELYRPTIKSCGEISLEFSREGFGTINKYGKYAFIPYTSIPRIYCFDDLGMEPPATYSGNTCNVAGEILRSRYDLFISHKMITHATTNLNANELEAFYGARLRSRMRSMFNLISYDSSSIDKRK